MKTKAFYPAFTTDDLEKTISFYTENFGFFVAHRVKTEQGRIATLENEAGARLDFIETPGVPGGFRAFRTGVADLDEAIRELKEKNCEIVTEPANDSNSRFVLARDPSGLLIVLVQHIRKLKG